MKPTMPADDEAVRARPSVIFYIVLASAVLIFLQTFALISPILHEELYRKRFLPTVTDVVFNESLSRNVAHANA